YRTLFRPKYKIGYKVVTELQWRCCPGHSGDACQDGPTPLPGFLPPYSGPKAAPGQNLFPPPHPKLQPETFPEPPAAPKKSGYGRMIPPVFGERLGRVEEELRRLSQSHDVLRGTVTGLGESLRLTLREDTGRMLGSLLSGSSSSAAAVGFGVISEALAENPGDLSGRVAAETPGGLSGRMAEVSGMLEEVNGMVMGHEAQIQHLLEAARPSPLTSTDLLERYLEGKLAAHRAELLDGLEVRLREVQGRDTGLSESCCGRQEELGKRLDALELRMEQLSQENRRLELELSRVSPDGRLDEVEERLNLTEEAGRRCCGDTGDRGQLLAELDGVKVAVDEKMRVLEERLLTAVGELGNATALQALDGVDIPLLAGVRRENEEGLAGVRRENEAGLAGVQSRLAAVEEQCAAGCSRPGEAEVLEVPIEPQQDLRARVEQQAEQLGQLNVTVLGLRRQLEQRHEEATEGEITLLRVNLRSVGRSLHGLEETVNRYSDAVLRVNSTAEERGSRLSEELSLVLGQVEGQGEQIRTGRTQLAGLRGDMERIRGRLAGQVGSCRHLADVMQVELAQFGRRVSRVEGACGGLKEGEHAEGVLGSLEQVNSMLAAQAQDLRGEVDGINQWAPSLALLPTTETAPGGQ
ncbi:hypothetical protein FKM82_022290, partial [Ascaphus truei]